MYHYNFTNDLRISSLDEILRDAANAFLTNTVPSASEDKSKNNNYNTVGFYFNLKAKGNSAKLSSKGNIKKVVLNFIKKFQYPNPRTPADFVNAKNDGILLAPMRDIVKLLHIFSLINNEEAYLTKNEIVNFIFYNNDLAKRQNYNLLNTASQIIQYRKDNSLPTNIDTDESSHEWNQPERQLREMIKTLNYSGCVTENGDKIQLNSVNISRDSEADLFEILNCNSYWTGESTEDYQKYMDEMEIVEEDMENKTEYNGESLNRIIFGAPGTGKSHKLEEESAAFLSQTPTQLDLFNIHLNNCKVNGDYVKFGMIHSAELKDMTVQEISDKYNRKGAYLIKKGAVLCNNLTVSSIEELPQEVEESIKSIPHGKKESKGLEIGYNYCYCLEGASKDSLISDYGAEPTVADWIMYGVEAAKSKIDKVTETQVSFMERVTFHPNYSYAQFVGAYKPKSDFVEIDGRSQKEISYEYVPGPFMRVYVNAINNPDKKFLLLIEEINRANVAAVFGDVFQLLDRKNGSSQYPVTASEDQKSFLKSVGIEDDKIIIPSNMYIWATMNSADQGVLPMDAAFKRRWDFEYLGIDDNQAQISTYSVPFTRNGSKTINWNDFRVKLNEKLAVELKINEDKQLGPFFMNENSLKNAALNPDKFVRLFESKVLMYLFEDVVKMNPKKLFSNCGEDLRYSKICEQWELNGPAIFNIDCEVSASEVASE